ncbi:hypothetical protein [Marinoscillum sp. 108]|uniref:hypothetical protein n=1 Tax=Marinoscillum sp. 108 TaxID=2653151 RepID=UPI00135C7EE7|nr:hypothetical protein [Marinoscillum sp. 108]
MISKLELITLSIIVLAGCSKPEPVAEYRDGKQFLNLNELNIKGESIEPISLVVIKPDSIKVKEEAIFRIVTSNPNFKLVNGIFDCNISNESLIDTSNFKVDNCKKEFVVRNDTMFIALKPGKTGQFEFGTEIIGITKGIDGILRYHTTTFNYEVAE